MPPRNGRRSLAKWSRPRCVPVRRSPTDAWWRARSSPGTPMARLPRRSECTTPTSLDLLDVGDRVDVYTASPERRDDPLLILDAPVVAIPTSDDNSAGGLVVLAVDGSAAARLAQHVAEAPLSVVLRD